MQWRALKDYKNPAWVMPRMADKFLFAFIITTLYLQTGDDMSQVCCSRACKRLLS
jgi:hypothetical protein